MGQENRTKTKTKGEKKTKKKPPCSIASAGQSLTRGDSHLFLPASSQGNKTALRSPTAPTGLKPQCRVVMISSSGL